MIIHAHPLRYAVDSIRYTVMLACIKTCLACLADCARGIGPETSVEITMNVATLRSIRGFITTYGFILRHRWTAGVFRSNTRLPDVIVTIGVGCNGANVFPCNDDRRNEVKKGYDKTLRSHSDLAFWVLVRGVFSWWMMKSWRFLGILYLLEEGYSGKGMNSWLRIFETGQYQPVLSQGSTRDLDYGGPFFLWTEGAVNSHEDKR